MATHGGGGCHQSPRPLPLPALLTRSPRQEPGGGEGIKSKSGSFIAWQPRG